MIQFRPYQPQPLPVGIVSGITLYLYPASTAFDIEIQSAPDVSGSPGSFTTVATLPGYTLSEAGTPYSQALPNDGKRRWYRYRHVRNAYTPSVWVGPASAVPSQAPQLANPSTTARPRSAFGAQTVDYDGTSLVNAVSDTRGYPVNGFFATAYQNIGDVADGGGYYRANATQLAGANRAYTALNASGRLTDQRNIPMVTVGNRNSAIVTSGYLTASNPSGNGVITINAFNLQFGFGYVHYNSGTVNTAFGAGQIVYVWAIDPTASGGSVVYYASLDYTDTLSNTDALFVGSVTIPNTGGSGIGGGGGGCVEVSSWVTPHCQASDVEPGHMLDCLSGPDFLTREVVQAVKRAEYRHCYRIRAECGAEVLISRGTPVTVENGNEVYVQHLRPGDRLPVDDCGAFRWEPVTVEYAGEHWVRPIDLGGATFAAGITPHQRIYTHNASVKAV